eukprot:9233032-Alexandrium_andersonii.AAC.1
MDNPKHIVPVCLLHRCPHFRGSICGLGLVGDGGWDSAPQLPFGLRAAEPSWSPSRDAAELPQAAGCSKGQ